MDTYLERMPVWMALSALSSPWQQTKILKCQERQSKVGAPNYLLPKAIKGQYWIHKRIKFMTLCSIIHTIKNSVQTRLLLVHTAHFDKWGKASFPLFQFHLPETCVKKYGFCQNMTLSTVTNTEMQCFLSYHLTSLFLKTRLFEGLSHCVTHAYSSAWHIIAKCFVE